MIFVIIDIHTTITDRKICHIPFPGWISLALWLLDTIPVSLSRLVMSRMILQIECTGAEAVSIETIDLSISIYMWMFVVQYMQAQFPWTVREHYQTLCKTLPPTARQQKRLYRLDLDQRWIFSNSIFNSLVSQRSISPHFDHVSTRAVNTQQRRHQNFAQRH